MNLDACFSLVLLIHCENTGRDIIHNPINAID